MGKVCIYHDNCTDGFMSFVVVKSKYPDTEGYPAKYGEAPPDVTGRDVVIVDFSYPRNVILDMKERAKSLLILDHHKTAKEALDGLDFAIFDMAKCGASLAFSYLFPDRSVPRIIEYIEDRDLWRRELPFSDLVANALWLRPKKFEEWEQLLHYNEEEMEELVQLGSTVEAVKNNIVEQLMRDKVEIRLKGLKLNAVNSAVYVSEIGNKLLETEPVGVVFSVKSGKVLFSLRSRDDRPDVSEIAKLFGGGGHRNAAGFEVSISQFINDVLVKCEEESK